MARHTNKDRYPVKPLDPEYDYLFGEDGLTGKSTNFKASEIIGGNFDQDNILKPIFTKKATGKTLEKAVEAVNDTEQFVVRNKESVYFVIPRNSQPTISTSTPTISQIVVDESILIYDYYFLQNTGKGIYGLGGELNIEKEDLLWFKSSQIYALPNSENGEPPIVYSIVTDDIAKAPENIVNNYVRQGGFNITNNRDYYFQVREINPILQPNNQEGNYTGNLVLYRFVGGAGNYGSTGTENAVSSDFQVIEINDNNTLSNTFLALLDVFDNSYTNKLGYAPIVKQVIGTHPNSVPKLRLTPVPTFSNIYGNSRILKGGLISIGDMSYIVWATQYIVNGVLYDTPVYEEVTLNDGGAEPRIDVFVLTLDTNKNPVSVSVEVLEGVPSSNPVKPTVDLVNQIEVTFNIVAAGQTTDPNVNTEIVFNDNTGDSQEWDNTLNISRADLDSVVEPYIGNSSFLLPFALNQNAYETVSWKNDAPITYDSEGNFNFALRTRQAWSASSRIKIKLVDSNNVNDAWSIELDAEALQLYGFNHRQPNWRVVSIAMDNFVNSNSNQAQFDTVEFSFKLINSDLNLDWINIQTGISQTEPINPVLEIKSSDNSVQITEFAPQRFDLKSLGGTGTGIDGKGWNGGSYSPSTGKVTFTSDDGLGFETGDLRGSGGSVTIQDDTRVVKFDNSYQKYTIDAPYEPVLVPDPVTQEQILQELELDLTDAVLGNSVQVYHTGVLPFENNTEIHYQNKEVYNPSIVNLLIFDYKSDQDITAVVINDEVIQAPLVEKVPKEVTTDTYLLKAIDKDFILHFTNVNGCTLTIPEGLPLNQRYEGKQLNTGVINFVTEALEETEIKTVPTQDKETAEINSVFAIDCIAQDVYLAFGNLKVLGGGGGGTGVSSYDELTDKASVNLPTVNTPLKNALATKEVIRTDKEVTAATYTILEEDKDKVLNFTNSTGCVVTVPETLSPDNEYQGLDLTDAEVEVIGGAITAGGNVEINVGGSELSKTDGKNSPFAIRALAQDVYLMYGKLESTAGGEGGTPYTLTKAKVEAVLTGTITTHTHANSAGTVVSTNIDGGTPFDISIADHYRANVLSNSTITLTGLPAVGETYKITAAIKSNTGVETLDVSNTVVEYGSYDPSAPVNFVTLTASNMTGTGIIIHVRYEQPTP